MMENYFKQNGCDGMWIGVFADNENARNVYKKYGFVDFKITSHGHPLRNVRLQANAKQRTTAVTPWESIER